MNKNVMYCECADIEWQNRKIVALLQRNSFVLAQIEINALIKVAKELQEDIERAILK